MRPAFRCERLLETPLVSALFPDQIIDRPDPDDDLKARLILMHADGLQLEVFIPLAFPFVRARYVNVSFSIRCRISPSGPSSP